MIQPIQPHFWLALATLLVAGGLLYLPSLVTGKLRLQHQAALRLAAEPLAFWPLLVLIWASRLALLWVACGAVAALS